MADRLGGCTHRWCLVFGDLCLVIYVLCSVGVCVYVDVDMNTNERESNEISTGGYLDGDDDDDDDDVVSSDDGLGGHWPRTLMPPVSAFRIWSPPITSMELR